MTAALIVQTASLDDRDVQGLLQKHFALMRSQSPPESCHVLDDIGLRTADAHIFAARADSVLLGIAALVRLNATEGEVKSMHTAQDMRGRGVGRALLRHLIGAAREEGLTRLSLETGSEQTHAPARALYSSFGFEPCPPFGVYVEDPLSMFMTRAL